MALFRNLPQDCVPEDRLWMVTFTEEATGKRRVQWCTGPEDAYALKQQVTATSGCVDVQSGQFITPEIRKWQAEARRNVFHITMTALKAEQRPVAACLAHGALLPAEVRQAMRDYTLVVFANTRKAEVEVIYASSTGQVLPLTYRNSASRERGSAWAARVVRDVLQLEKERYRHECR